MEMYGNILVIDKEKLIVDASTCMAYNNSSIKIFLNSYTAQIIAPSNDKIADGELYVQYMGHFIYIDNDLDNGCYRMEPMK